MAWVQFEWLRAFVSMARKIEYTCKYVFSMGMKFDVSTNISVSYGFLAYVICNDIMAICKYCASL